jgi:hypothetical protein
VLLPQVLHQPPVHLLHGADTLVTRGLQGANTTGSNDRV